MKDLTPKEQKKLDKLMERFVEQLSDANVAYGASINCVQVLSESPNSPALKHKIATLRDQHDAFSRDATLTREYITSLYPDANFTIAAQQERELRSQKEANLKVGAQDKLKKVVLEALQTDVQKIELRQSYEAQQDPQTAITLRKIKNETVPTLKKAMQDTLLELRGAGYSKVEASDITKDIIRQTYIEMTAAAIEHANAVKLGDDPNAMSIANEKIGFIGESALNKHLNPSTIVHEAHELINHAHVAEPTDLIAKTKAVSRTSLNEGFASELMNLKRELAENGMSLAEAVSQLPDDAQAQFRQNNKALQNEQESTLSP